MNWTTTPAPCETAANRLKRAHPYRWDLNAYRGCAHGCRYCYAQYTHQYTGKASFSRDILVKTNIAEKLEAQLAAPGWQREVVNLGGVTDNYQPAEADWRLMPDILRLLIKYKTPAIISTKSALVLRDYDLIDELSRVAWVNVAASVTMADDALRQKLESGAASVGERFEVLRAFRQTNATTGLHCMPIIPFVTDGAANFEALFEQAADCAVDYVLPGVLYLRGSTKPAFLGWMEDAFPEMHPKLKALYKTGSAGADYKNAMYPVLNLYRDKYGLSSSYAKPMKRKMAELAAAEPAQLSLFDEK